MHRYIWQYAEWPHLTYDSTAVLNPLSQAVERYGVLLGRLDALGFGDRQDASLEVTSQEVIQSSGIEGEVLDYNAVRSSVARRLGIEAGVASGDHRVEGVVEMALDAVQNWKQPLTKDRLFNWHAGLFPSGRGPHGPITTGSWRTDSTGPMQVVSGPLGAEKVHFEAPPAVAVDSEMTAFLEWFEGDDEPNGILKAGIAHLWFVTVHPFDDGNGRIGRAILDLALARYDRRDWRSYSLSSQIRQERKGYYHSLENAQKRNTDITLWLLWYLKCLENALAANTETIAAAVSRTRFWQHHADKAFNERQKKVLKRILVSWEGKLTRQKWQKLTDASPKTASRDLAELVRMGILDVEGATGRGVSYRLLWPMKEDETSAAGDVDAGIGEDS